jgi:hypothetical protein
MSRWIRAAVAALVLTSGASLLAQTDKDKKPAPAHKTTPPPTTKSSTPAPSGGQPASRPATPPGTPQAQRPATTTPSAPQAQRPAYTPPPSTPQAQRPAYTPPASHTPGGTMPNDRPRPPAGNTTSRPGFYGGSRPAFHGPNGTAVSYRANGQPAVVHARNGMVITHGPSGMARTEFVRPDRSVIVTQGSRWGYVQRPYAVGGVSYVQRTYVIGGVPRAYIYRPYMYHGFSLNVYVSSHYYAPAFYGWAYTPWARPVVFSFGWGPSPWFGFYAGYFSPYPVYPGPAYWLTDYMIAMTLQDAYNQQVQANAAAAAAAQANASAAQATLPIYDAPPAAQTALTPDVKQAIADEVHRQLDQERAESQASAPQGGPGFLADNSTHVFVVAGGLNVQSAGGECMLTEGDVLQLSAPPAGNSDTANLAVLASKGQDCRRGSMVTVAIADLQEMQNHMRQTLDQGLADLQARQGNGGIPAAPPAASAPPVTAVYAQAAPPPDPNVATEVSQQAETAIQAENDVLGMAQASGPSAAAGAPQSVSLGMTIDQVVGLLGQPTLVGDLGSKKIYSYGNMKVIFIDGKVTDIQ